MIKLESKFMDKFRIFGRNIFLILILGVGMPTLAAIFFPSFQDLISKIADSLQVFIFIPYVIAFIVVFIMAFRNKTTYVYEDGVLTIKRSDHEKSYDLAKYELTKLLETSIGTLFIPDKKQLILISKDTGKKEVINFREKNINDVADFISDIEMKLNREIKHI